MKTTIYFVLFSFSALACESSSDKGDSNTNAAEDRAAGDQQQFGDGQLPGSQAPASSSGGQIIVPTAPPQKAEDVWFAGWDTLMKNGGADFVKTPTKGQLPTTIKAKPVASPTPVRILDYWLRPNGWTTMLGHAVEKYSDTNYRTDGVRWDTPKNEVPTMENGTVVDGHMTLFTQFATEIPSYWAGATPHSAQTEWIFRINKTNGSIREVYDRQHFTVDSAGKIKPFFSELIATSPVKSLVWAPEGTMTMGDARFQSTLEYKNPKNGQIHQGHSAMEIIGQYEELTIPPTRHKGGDCPATTFKDVIAVKQYQWWWEPATSTSRADFTVVYMAKNVGWVYYLISSGLTYDANNNIIKDEKHTLHLAPQGYFNKSLNYKRLCPREFRDMMLSQ